MQPGTKLKAIIVDDEYPARLMIKNLCAGHIHVIGEARTAREALELINEQRPDVVFLDINLPDKNGFEILAELSHVPFIIFTTAYEQYAVKAFEANAVDYLVKPIEEKRFVQSIQKLERLKSSAAAPPDVSMIKELIIQLQEKKHITSIPIKTGDKFILIRLEDVAYLEAREKYVYVNTADDSKFLSDTRLSEFEETLPLNFIRVQKSFIVNKDRIAEIHKYFGNRLIITMNNKSKTRITTGITYINEIRKSLGL